MDPHTPPRDRGEFGIAIICALPLEADYVQLAFDRHWEKEGKQYGKRQGDKNAYTTGSIGQHNVVLVHMPSMGNTTSAAVAANLVFSFPNIQLCLVVGICGAVPFPQGTKDEIILGDVIMSTSLVQYDFGRQYPAGFDRKRGVEDSLGRANREVLAMVAKLKTRRGCEDLRDQLKDHLLRLQSKAPSATYPGADLDQLYEASYPHRHQLPTNNSCDKCRDDIETCSASCAELGCEATRLIRRQRLDSPKQNSEIGIEPIPSVHFGPFGSANSVMKSAAHRDMISKADRVLAFEMEGAGVWTELPTIVMKAACDYADSHKHKNWQQYAAASAAACMSAFLRQWIIPDSPSQFVSYVPFDRLKRFVGRNKELHYIKERISQSENGAILAFHGLGGVGKSRLALEIAKEIKSNTSVLWIQATNQLTFEKDASKICAELCVPGIDDAKADAKILLREWLSNSETHKWLLIIDNADDEALWVNRNAAEQQELLLRKYLPKTRNGSILVTTRARTVAISLAGQEVVTLGEMTTKESMQMFMDSLIQPDATANQEATLVLLEKLQYLPLAISQAAAFLNENQVDVETYIEVYDSAEHESIELLSEDFDDQSRYETANNPVATTWLISFENIRKYHPLAATFLSYMACLHEKGIPLSLLPVPNPSTAASTKALGILTGYSFVSAQKRSTGLNKTSERLYDMHRLVRLATRNWLKRERSFEKHVREALQQVADVFTMFDYEEKPTWSLYLPHSEALCSEQCTWGIPERYMILTTMGHCFQEDGHYSKATEKHTTVLKWREQELGSFDASTVEVYNNLAYALLRSGNPSEASRYSEKAMNWRAAMLGPRNKKTLNSMDLHGEILHQLGHYVEAEEILRKVIQLREAELGDADISTLASKFDLARVLKSLGNYAEAERVCRGVIQLEEKVLGGDHDNTMASKQLLADVLILQDRVAEAEILFQEVLKQDEARYGGSHPTTLWSKHRLADTLQNQGHYSDSERLFREIYESRKQVLGMNHPDTLTTRNDIAILFECQDRYLEAEKIYREVLPLVEKRLGSDHRYYLQIASNLASLLKRVGGHDEEATALMTFCYETLHRRYGALHPQTQSTQRRLVKWGVLIGPPTDEEA
ncbi:hypothetical protein BX600DRAFT_515940 [Xylariales sp. PMI_506]|nr:hypothetical protein BX600DRAFT_515940 [Xylariales sp. PMI_506]